MEKEQISAQEEQALLDKDPSRRPVGRPTVFTQELADRLCEQWALGKSIRTICAAEDMPAISTVFKWLRDDEKFSEQYARAKEEAADLLVEDMLDIADDSTADYEEDKKGNLVFNKEAVLRSKLRTDTRKWISSKLKPKRYGDKIDVTSGDKPLKEGTTPTEVIAQTLLAIYERNPITQTSQTPDGDSGSDPADLS